MKLYQQGDSLKIDFWDEKNLPQSQFVQDNTPYSALVGGVGSGKTYGGAIKSLKYCLEHPGAKVLVTGKTHPLVTEALLSTYFEVFPEPFLKSGGYHRSPPISIETQNGCRLFFTSWEEYQNLIAYNVAAVHFDEAGEAVRDAFTAHTRRIRQPGYPHVLWITTTPKGFNWLFQEFPPDNLRAGRRLFRCSTKDNHYLEQEVWDEVLQQKVLKNTYVERLEAEHHGALARQYIEGEFVEIGGECVFDTITALPAQVLNCHDPLETRMGGACKIWEKATPGERYAMGVDTGEGVGLSRSALHILNCRTGKQALVLAGQIAPDLLARHAVDLSKEYHNAFLVCEAHGVGKSTMADIQALGYGNIFYMDEKHIRPGFDTYWQSKMDLIMELDKALRAGLLVLQDFDTVDELFSFIHAGNRMEAAQGKRDDLVMSLALARWGMKERPHVGQMPKALSFMGRR